MMIKIKHIKRHIQHDLILSLSFLLCAMRIFYSSLWSSLSDVSQFPAQVDLMNCDSRPDEL